MLGLVRSIQKIFCWDGVIRYALAPLLIARWQAQILIPPAQAVEQTAFRFGVRGIVGSELLLMNYCHN